MTEVKVIASSAVTLVMSCILAIVIAVQDDPQIIAGLPTWLQFVIIAVLPPVAAWLGGYLKSSPTSAASRGFVGTYRRGEVEDGR
jgi:membrane protein implicated in regulation of membrane protease activity